MRALKKVLTMQATAAEYDIGLERGLLKLTVRGDWRARYLGAIDQALRDLNERCKELHIEVI